ncbi:MAG: hypothetical protein IT424_10780 [Pirellulales bacterium]|nr:hypothetical protein [Pirellulales bacterium]
MSLDYDLVQSLQNQAPADAWASIFGRAWDVCSPPIDVSKAHGEVTRRDRTVGDLDLYLATAGWDLWSAYEASVPLTSDALATWWSAQSGGKAVLILDALSLREAPWLLAGAEERGFTVHDARPTGAELPADTTPFAKSLGFSQRSALGNNGAGGAHKLAGARTDCTDVAWEDCAALVGSEPAWVFWHHWPDCTLHAHDDPGKGLSSLTDEVVEHLTGDAFWKLVFRLAEGRRLVITGDHGYAASGHFPDSDRDQTEYLKGIFKSGRWDGTALEPGAWAPPIDLLLQTRHGNHLFVNGRRKWRSAGGYPTLTHGGLTVLEVAVPFIELSRK